MSDPQWQRQSREKVYEDQWLTLYTDVLTSDIGKKEYTIVDRPNGVVVIPMTADGKILLQRQWRMATLTQFWEFPAGKIEVGQTPEQTAHAELAEETGLQALSIRRIGGFYPVAGLMPQYIDVFVADIEARDSETLASHDPLEGISEYRFVALHDVLTEVGAGKIDEGFTLMALMLLIGSRHGLSSAK